MPENQKWTGKTKQPSDKMRDGGNGAISAGMEGAAETQDGEPVAANDAVGITQSLIQSRLNANLDAWQSLMSCRELRDLVRLQNEYVENATGRYRDYTQEMFGCMIRMNDFEPNIRSQNRKNPDQSDTETTV